MRRANCPRLSTQEATLRAMYTHMTKADIRELRRWHYCADCPGAWVVPLHLSRDPEDE